MAIDIIVNVDASDAKQEVNTLAGDFKELQTKAANSTNGINKAVKGVNQSLGEMKRELRELRNTSFMDKTHPFILCFCLFNLDL